MSEISHSDELVTKQDLSNFYQGILPYLGGMPEMVTNKFTKSDLYSTDEKIIGQWVDGKPIYQKTVDFGALPNNTTKTVPHNISNIGKLIDIIATADDGDGVQRPLPIVHDTTISNQTILNINTNEIWCRTKTNLSGSTAYVTIRYTKSTDGAISMGSDTDYSTTEKIVGTWVNGKPVYQKTIDVGALPNNKTKSVRHGISNLKMCVDVHGVFTDGTTTMTIPFPSASGSIVTASVSATEVSITTTSNRTAYSGYVYITYTKTTD